MPNLQTVERGYGLKNRLVASTVAAASIGGALLMGERADASERKAAPKMAPVAMAEAAGTALLQAGHDPVDPNVTGRVETPHGEPLVVMDDPFGMPKGEYGDGSDLQIRCQTWGQDAPGGPPSGEPPMTDRTWYLLGDVPDARWVPANWVFVDDRVPSCPPR